MEYSELGLYDLSNPVPEDLELMMYGDGTTHYASDGYIPTEGFVEDFTNAEFHEAHTIIADGGDRFGVSAVAFDQQEELLWMGNQGGHVTSYVGSGMQKYTSFQVHANQEVRHIHTFNDGILALTQTSLRCQMRRGIPIFTHTSENMVEMQCQLQISPDTVIMGGHQDQIIQFNMALGQETGMFCIGENGCAILREHGRYICAGDPSGRITLHDPATLRVEHTLEAHSGSLSDFDVHGNQLVTCGFSNRHGSLSVDRFLMIYDLRMMRAMSPIQVMLEPLLMRFLPSFSSRLVIVSTLGQMQLMDTVATSADPGVYQLNTGGSMCLSFDVSSSGQCLGFGDGGGNVHLYAAANHTPQINTFSRDTEFADPVEALEPISILDEHTPLSSIPMPYCQQPLLSDWPEELCKKIYRRAPLIDTDILRSMKVQGTIGYAPNPNKTRRNQVGYKLEKHSSQPHSKHFRTDFSSSKSGQEKSFVIPKRYRKQEVKYSKSGMEDFDMDQYNKTSFSGLEATLPNSYCNPMLQVLYYLLPVRHMFLSHLCHHEFCLSCELGFLFHMLDTSQGFPCQSSNFLRAFRTVPEAANMGLILSDAPHDNKRQNITRLIQSWNKFILLQTHTEVLEAKRWKTQENQNNVSSHGEFFIYKEKDFPSIIGEHAPKHVAPVEDADKPQAANPSGDTQQEDEDTEVSDLFGMKQTHIHKCLKCQQEVSKESTQLLCNLIYPEMTADKTAEYSFSSVLLKSICPEHVTPAWCNKCDKFQPTLQSRRLKTLPQVLAINCGLDTVQDKTFWQTQMDLVVQKVVDKAAPPAASQGKPCRYGANCSRPTCRFYHAGRSEETTTSNTNHLYYMHSWLPMHLRIDLLTKGGVNIERLQPTDEASTQQEGTSDSISYDLSAVVCYINDEKKNLVALVNVSPAYHQRSGSPVSQWYIFNDLTISPVAQQDVVWFSLEWKVPCILYWTNHDHMRQTYPAPIVNPLTLDVFGEDKCLARNGKKMITFTPLAADEMPGKGDIVAMDAEFVTLNQEEAELRSDGKMSTIKPSHMSVARITCIRGQGPMSGSPFIDDYISTQEAVVDYLTKFSGIKPGDLDANFSSKHLTTLKSTYQKLRFLVDNGVVFLGHGLKNDFRVINIVVPPDQIIDTVLLYHLPHNRMVSLRFLAWHFLNLKIQAVTHDSIEDARTALQLYQCYQQLEAKGCFKAKLKELYEVGKRLQWKIPGIDVN